MSYKNLIFETDDRIGIIKVNRPEVKMEEAMGLARQIGQGPAAIHFAKQSMFQSSQHLFQEALNLDSEIYGEVYKTKDFKEGVTAFLEKRKPVFKND